MTDPSTSSGSASIETVEKDYGRDPASIAKYWEAEIKVAEKRAEEWQKPGREVVEVYRGQRRGTKTKASPPVNYNILWANTETMKPAVFGRSPVPVVRRRITDQRRPDPIGRIAATILERALSYSIEDYDFDTEIASAVEDFLLPGRGQVRVKYSPLFHISDPEKVFLEHAAAVEENKMRYFVGEYEVPAALVQNPTLTPGDLTNLSEEIRPYYLVPGEETVVYEQALCAYVYWENFLHGPGRRWPDVPWVAFRHRLTRENLTKQFKDKGKDIELDWAPSGLPKNLDDGLADMFKRATVWEVWSKRKREVLAIAPSYDEGPLDTWSDPLKLENFFPVPEPLDFVRTNDTLEPIPVYTLYQDQANEVIKITRRIDCLVAQLKVRGLYDGTETELQQLMKKNDGELVAVSNWAEHREKGGIAGVLEFLPLGEIVTAIAMLRQQREQAKQIIYEITGISDIIRGASDPRETKGAQVIKARFAGLRQQTPIKKVQRFVRDVLRLKAEIIAEHFSPDTLALMSDIPYQPQGVISKGNGAEPPDEQTLNPVITDEVVELLRDQTIRGFRIEIETDSTIEPDEQAAKKEATEMIGAVSNYLQNMGQVVERVPQFGPFLMELLKLGLRHFRPGRTLEEALDKAGEALSQIKPSPSAEEIRAQTAMRIAELEAEVEREKTERRDEAAKRKTQLEVGKTLTETAAKMAGAGNVQR